MSRVRSLEPAMQNNTPTGICQLRMHKFFSEASLSESDSTGSKGHGRAILNKFANFLSQQSVNMNWREVFL